MIQIPYFIGIFSVQCTLMHTTHLESNHTYWSIKGIYFDISQSVDPPMYLMDSSRVSEIKPYHRYYYCTITAACLNASAMSWVSFLSQQVCHRHVQIDLRGQYSFSIWTNFIFCHTENPNLRFDTFWCSIALASFVWSHYYSSYLSCNFYGVELISEAHEGLSYRMFAWTLLVHKWCIYTCLMFVPMTFLTNKNVQSKFIYSSTGVQQMNKHPNPLHISHCICCFSDVRRKKNFYFFWNVWNIWSYIKLRVSHYYKTVSDMCMFINILVKYDIFSNINILVTFEQK